MIITFVHAIVCHCSGAHDDHFHSTSEDQASSSPQSQSTGIDSSPLDSQERCSSLKDSCPLYTVKITCLARTTTGQKLLELVQEYGRVLNSPKIQGSSNRYAWVNFALLEDAKNAVEHLNDYCFEGRNINVSLKTSSTPTPLVSSLPKVSPVVPVPAVQTSSGQARVKKMTPVIPQTVPQPYPQSKPFHSNPDACYNSQMNTQLQCLSAQDLLLRINYELENINSRQQEKIFQLTQQKAQIQIPKKCPLDLFQVLQSEKTDLSHKITESESQQREFNVFCNRLCANAQRAASSQSISVSVEMLEQSFARECSRFHKGLPIYSHRQEIVEMIRNNQVSVLTAETGSGKSTQLVQYLYEEGFSDTGVIVCTQPRKVAAMSLAKYVSSEMFADPGTIVGYKTGLHGNYTGQTKVIYMTDHTLLNECVEDSNFSKYSCLIVDEAHERNLNTDVLLAFIKRCLPRRPELRVVITSATIDPKSFTQYFGQNCPVKKVPGRTFPVDVTYCPLDPTQPPRGMADYVFGAIKLADTLHNNEPAGDILIFLTSPGEVEQACLSLEELTNNSAVVLPLHGRLQPDDQQKVFMNYHQRKIVFSTNVAETSVTIPGVKYIIDSGRAKELCFDAKKNMNSLEVRLISKSSAEQRKGRAGRTSAGKCYRLYTEETYQEMSERMVPEILRVSLAGTVLKLHELGIRNVLTFDFIEKPEESALKSAVDTLEFLGAVSAGRLTNIGKWMAALPIDPRLAKVILDGLREKVGTEAIAVASISSLAGTIFFRGGTDEMKERSDLLKTKFCDPHGDQLTYFNTYCHWEARLPQDRNAWCVENSINAKSMRIVHETIKDLTEILRKQLKITVPTSTLSFQEASEKLPKILFKAFANNLCAFLGHERIGYFNPNLPEEKLVIFPGSCLCSLGLQPKLLVYEKTLKTSQHFLLQTFPVEEEWVQEALKSGIIAYHPTSCEQFKKRVVTSFTIKDLGESVLSAIVLPHKQREIIEQISTATSNQVQFVATPDQGMLKVFVQESFCQPLQIYLQQYIKNLKEEMKSYRHEAGVTADGDNVRVLIGSGGSVSRILMPHEYRSLFARGPVVGTWHEELAGKLGECGAILSQQTRSFQKERRLWVTFHDSKDAEKASKLTPPPGISLAPQLPKKEDSLSEFSLTVMVEWARRERKNFVNIDMRTNHLSTIISQLSNSGATIGGCLIRFRVSKFNDYHIFANNVPPRLPETEVREAFERILTPVGYMRHTYTVIFAYSPGFETSPEQYQLLEAKLRSFIPPAVTRGKYSLRLLEPQPFHKVYKAFINFINIDEGMTALSSLENASIDGKPLRVSRSLSSSIKYSPGIYAAVQTSVQETSESVKTQYPSVKATNSKDKAGNTIVKVESTDPTDYVAVLKMFNSVLRPEVIQCLSQLHFEYMRSKRCEKNMTRIEGLSSTVIRRDFRLKCIKIYGTKENTAKAKTEFDKCLSFGGDVNYRDIELKKSGRPPGLLKYLITTFGIDLGLLVKQKGIEMARVDIRRHKLILFASEAGYQLVLDIIEQFTTTNASKTQANPSLTVSEVECCACYTPIDAPEDTYRLEYCGHTYHYDCVEAQLAPNTVTIPVLCAADGCDSHFVWQDFKNLESKKKVDPRNIITESVRAYLAANQDVVHNCPTPDCPMVYAVTDERSCFLCSHCGLLTCTKCHKPFHSGLTCAQNEYAASADEDLKRWLEVDTANRKRCPRCGAPIEKTGGCAHIHCTQCNSHICWHCLTAFSSPGDCYGHLSSNHGGFT